MAKLYKSKQWLLLQHHVKGKSLKEIAKECGVAEMTIRRHMDDFGIKIAK